MFGGAAEAVAAAKTLTAAIPAAPMAVLTAVVVDFTLTPSSSRYHSSGSQYCFGCKPHSIDIASDGNLKRDCIAEWHVRPDYLRKWRDIIFAPRHGSNNFFNIGITCHHFGKLTPHTYARALLPTVLLMV